MAKKKKGGRSTTTLGASTSTAMPIASMSVGPDRTEPLDVKNNLTVDDLKSAIRNKKQLLAEFDADDLIVWKHYIKGCSLSESQSENLEHCLHNEVPLGAVQILSIAFPDVSVGYIHVIVKTPLDASPTRKRVRLVEPHTPIMDGAAPETKLSPPRLPQREFESSVTAALQPFDQHMTDLAKGKYDGYFSSTESGPLPTIPGVEPQKALILLLHSLGNYPDDPRLEKVFKSDTVHLFAVSGSGKTRLTLEGLCHRWGLYISCRGGDPKRASGSRDFIFAIERMAGMSNWNQSTNHNVNAAHQAFAMLICARVFVLKRLLEKLPVGTTATMARKRWILVQVMPPVDIVDIFVAVFESLRGAEKTDMIVSTVNMLRDIKKLFGTDFFPTHGLSAIIDEAQVAAEYLNKSVRSTTTDTENSPVLHPFYSFLWYTKLFKEVILAGTGLSMKMVRALVEGIRKKLCSSTRTDDEFPSPSHD